jgi:hypothetical protein
MTRNNGGQKNNTDIKSLSDEARWEMIELPTTADSFCLDHHARQKFFKCFASYKYRKFEWKNFY